MNLVHLALLIHMARCIDIQVQILSFDMKLEAHTKDHRFRSLTTTTEGQYSNQTNVTRDNSEKNRKIQDDLNCPSQDSEKKQIKAVLSDMMNQLTLVFVKVNNYIAREVTKATRKFLNADLIRRALQNRFKISKKKRKLVFDEIFNNVSQSYRNLYNLTTRQVFRADSHCRSVENQKLWNLLEYSLLNLRKAMRYCIAEYLKEHTISPKSALGKKVNELLITEISQIRSKQLDMLCDKFQLCNSTILQDFMWHI